MRATLSIMGLYQYDETVFDGLILPVGVEKQTAIDTICMQLEGLEVLYPSVPAMRAAITAWAARRAHAWGKLYATMNFSYEPLENFKRVEDVTDTRTGSVGYTGSDEAKRYQAGFNDPVAAEVERTTSTPGVTTTSDDSATHSATYHGSIGVITPQQHIKQERDVADFDLYQIICDEFKREFCIMVY